MVEGLSVLMPVYNELQTVATAIEDVLSAELPIPLRELVVVDDGSSDGTAELLREETWPAQLTVVHHPRNRGKGAALRTALERATGEYAAVFDADLEYHASDLAPILEPLLAGDANVVFGTRAWHSHSSYGFWYVMGNKTVTFATNLIYNCWISDVMTCHKAIRTDIFRSLPLRDSKTRRSRRPQAPPSQHQCSIHSSPARHKAERRSQTSVYQNETGGRGDRAMWVQ